MMCNIDKSVPMKPKTQASTQIFPFKLIGASYGIADARTPLIERHDYECCTVEFVYKGRGGLDINGFDCNLGENSVYILHKHSHHRYWPDKGDPWAKIFFVIDGELMDTLFKAYRMDDVYAIPDCPQLKKYFDEMRQLKPGIGELHQQAAVIFHRLLEECHAILYGSAEHLVSPAILELKKHLDGHLEKKFNLADYCRAHKHSCAHMIRSFKYQYGASPYDYLMQKRIDAARLMLRHSAFSVKEIAARLMFSDQYYFSNYFKRKTGVSPRKFKMGTVAAPALTPGRGIRMAKSG